MRLYVVSIGVLAAYCAADTLVARFSAYRDAHCNGQPLVSYNLTTPAACAAMPPGAAYPYVAVTCSQARGVRGGGGVGSAGEWKATLTGYQAELLCKWKVGGSTLLTAPSGVCSALGDAAIMLSPRAMLLAVEAACVGGEESSAVTETTPDSENSGILAAEE